MYDQYSVERSMVLTILLKENAEHMGVQRKFELYSSTMK